MDQPISSNNHSSGSESIVSSQVETITNNKNDKERQNTNNIVLETKSGKRTSEDTSQHEQRVNDLENKIRELLHNLESVSIHKLEETKLRKRAFEMEAELRDHIKSCQAKINQREEEIQQLKEKLETEVTERSILEQHFTLVDKNQQIIRHEEEIIAAKLQREKEEQDRLYYAASKIQSLFRSRRDRNLMKQMLKKKQKKKKGKGKKGKGKK